MGGSRLARLTARLGVFAAILFLIGPTLAHFELVRPLAGFIAFALGGLLSVITVIIGAIAFFGSSRQVVIRGLIPALLVVVVFFMQASKGRNVPRINDITTDTANPPQFVTAAHEPANLGRDMSYPGETFATQQRAGYPDLGPQRLAMPADAAYAKVRAAAHAMPAWQVTREDPGTFTIEGFETSSVFRFRDDFVIQVRPSATGSDVQMRSKSRDGKGDLGVNAGRIRRFFETLNR